MKLAELVCNPQGKLSHTRCWANVAFASSTAIVIKMAWANNLSVEMFFVYLAIVGSSAQASKFLNYKYGGNNGQ